MNRLTILGTAALVVSALAVPAAAREVTSSNTGNSYTGKHMRHHAHYRTTRPANPRADDAADIAGAAVGTADAIAIAPFGAANAYDKGYYGPYYHSYYGIGWNGGT